MKRIALLALPALLLFSCKKTDTVNTEEVRLLQTKWSDGNGNVHTALLSYDAEGRIVALSVKTNNDPATVSATVSYAGSEVRITEPVVSNAATMFTREIKFVVNGSNQPVSRIESRNAEYYATAGNPQRDFYTDTATYSYDASGLLTKITGNSRDSVWYKPGYEQTSVRLQTYTVNYTNVNGNLAEMTRIAQENYHTTVGTTTLYSRSSREEKNTFDYSKAYPNNTDFKNAFLLEEFGVILNDYPLNRNYRNLPSQVTTSVTEKDGTGAVTYTGSSTFTLTFSFNKYGFLSLIGDNPDQARNKELIYSH